MGPKDLSYQISSKFKIKNPPFPLGGKISPWGSNPQNIKLNYPKILHFKFHQNPTLILVDTSQTMKKLKLPSHLGGNFPTGVQPPKKHTKGTQGSLISNFLEIQNFKKSPF